MAHKFIKAVFTDSNFADDHECEICGLKAFPSYPKGNYIHYFVMNGFERDVDVDVENITCEEFIIKKIIE